MNERKWVSIPEYTKLKKIKNRQSIYNKIYNGTWPKDEVRVITIEIKKYQILVK